jgi:hypothetical protein
MGAYLIIFFGFFFKGIKSIELIISHGWLLLRSLPVV